jgi:hypothetical protein
MEPLVVLYAKAVDDKELGIYVEGIYFGGVAHDKARADEIADFCVNNVRGGTAIARVMLVGSRNTMIEVFREAKVRFDKVERDMIETEDILQANSTRVKRRRK